MCAAEAVIFVYLLRRRFDGGCTCAFHRFDNMGNSVRIRDSDIPGYSGLPRMHGISVAPSGRFPSVRDRSIGSLVAGIWAFLTARQMMSFNCECRMCLVELFVQERPCSPLASTAVLQIHV